MTLYSPTQDHTVAIVGLGYVGLPLAVLADRKGYSTIGMDTDATRVAQRTRREAPFADPALRDALRRSTFIATAHAPFKALSPAHLPLHGVRPVIDGRNGLRRERFIKAGLGYRSIGR